MAARTRCARSARPGVWELLIPGLGAGSTYKFDILGPDGAWHRKADPMAGWAERPPATASVVTECRHEWGDGSG